MMFKMKVFFELPHKKNKQIHVPLMSFLNFQE